MNYKMVKVQLKDGKLPYMYEKANFCLEDNILCVESSTGVTYCFPIENVMHYQFERE